MTHISKTLFASVILVSTFALSCNKDLENPSANVTPPSVSNSLGASNRDGGSGITVLGNQRANAFDVNLIRQAYNILYEPDVTYISPSHLYVRFLPQNPEDLGELLKTGLDFEDYPLDRDVIYAGEFYHDPAVLDTNYTWMYTVVSPSFNFSSLSVTYEVLAPVLDIPENTQLAKTAFTLTNNLDIYEDTGNYQPAPTWNNGVLNWPGGGESSDGAPEASGCSCPIPGHSRYAAGCVRVADELLGISEGVQNIQVGAKRVGLPFFTYWSFTDEKGCFEIQHKFYNKAKVFIKFSSSTCDIKVMHWDGDLEHYTFPRKDEVLQKNGPNFNGIEILLPWSNAIGSREYRNWIAATVNNSVHEFNDFASKESINRAPGDLKILITTWGDGNVGSTPMFDKMGNFSPVVNTSVGWLAAMGVTTLGPFWIALGVWMSVAAPDITLNWNVASQCHSDDVRETAYHELAHAIHFSLVGEDYWEDEVNYTISNNGYGDGSAPGAGRCAIVEAWGYMVGKRMADDRYGLLHSNSPSGTLGRWARILERDFTESGFIPSGWLNDLIDNNAANPFGENSTIFPTGGTDGDAVSGFTLSQIYSSMKPSTGGLTPSTQRNFLRSAFMPSATTTVAQFNTLAGLYPLF